MDNNESNMFRWGSYVAPNKRLFECVDKIFAAFMTTNIHQGRRYSMGDIMEVHDLLTFSFEQEHQLYMAFADFERGYETNWVVLQLPSECLFRSCSLSKVGSGSGNPSLVSSPHETINNNSSSPASTPTAFCLDLIPLMHVSRFFGLGRAVVHSPLLAERRCYKGRTKKGNLEIAHVQFSFARRRHFPLHHPSSEQDTQQITCSSWCC